MSTEVSKAEHPCPWTDNIKHLLREVCSKQNENMLYLLWIAAHHYLCLIWTHGPLLPNIAISCIVLSECLQRNNTVSDPLPGRIIPNVRHVAVAWTLSSTNTESTGFHPVVQPVPFRMSIWRWCYISSLCLCMSEEWLHYLYISSLKLPFTLKGSGSSKHIKQLRKKSLTTSTFWH